MSETRRDETKRDEKESHESKKKETRENAGKTPTSRSTLGPSPTQNPRKRGEPRSQNTPTDKLTNKLPCCFTQSKETQKTTGEHAHQRPHPHRAVGTSRAVGLSGRQSGPIVTRVSTVPPSLRETGINDKYGTYLRPARLTRLFLIRRDDCN